MSKARNTGNLNNSIQISPTGNITFVNGNTTLMEISSSGAIVTTGTISGSDAANAISASYAQAATSASFASVATSSSFATTSLTSSFANNLTVAGTITAQTLNVQQVTSSVVYSSGSNVFGNSLSNTQVMTGSVGITGSLNVNGTSAFAGSVTLSAANNQIRSGNELRFYRTDNGIYTQLYDGGSANGFVLDNRNGDGFNFQSAGTSQLRIASTGAATFASSINATSATFVGRIGTSLTSTGVNLANSSLYVNNTANTKGAIFGYDDSNDRFYFASIEHGVQYKPILFNTSAATFANSISATSAGISSTSISTSANTTLASSRGIIVDAATTTNNAFIPIGFSWASSISNYNPTWGMGLKTINYNAGTADLVFYTNSTVRMTINNGGAVTVNGNIAANNIRTFSLTLQGLSTPVSTGLDINGYTGGRTYLLLTSQQWDAGNSTSSTITMIRCGYDGNNFTAVVLASSNAQPETWSQSGGILFVTGNTNFQMDITVLSNG